MTKNIWINLPVSDVARCRAFYEKMGFTFNTRHGNTADSVCLLVGEKNIPVMFFEVGTFKNFVNGDKIVPAREACEVLISIDAPSKERVDELAEKARQSGGTSDHKSSEMKSWMYGCMFKDPDGHRWNVLHMDMSRMPK